jgi:hypothetical protein
MPMVPWGADGTYKHPVSHVSCEAKGGWLQSWRAADAERLPADPSWQTQASKHVSVCGRSLPLRWPSSACFAAARETADAARREEDIVSIRERQIVVRPRGAAQQPSA